MRQKRRTPSRREWLLLLIPLVALALDFGFSPRLIENSATVNQVSLVSLLEKRHLVIGTFHGHEFVVNIGRVAQPRYLQDLAAHRPNALTISSFVGDGVRLGEVGWAVTNKLQRVSPQAASHFNEMLREDKAFVPGDVRDLSLNLSPEQRGRFPVDHLLIAVMDEENGKENTDLLPKLFPTLLHRAAAANVETLVIPIIGYNWKDDHAMRFSSFFRELLASATREPKPPRIVVDLYSGWPRFVLEQAVGEINASAEQFDKPASELRLHRQQIRELYVLLAVCLLASSFYAPLTIKNFLIIVCAYSALFLGAAKTLDFMTDGWPASTAQLASLAAYILLAAMFPIICRWNPKDIFAPPT
jgi:hypothetical protein